MKLSAEAAGGGGAAAAPVSSPQHDAGVVALPPRHEALAVAPVNDDFVGIGLSIAPDMTVIFLHPLSCRLLLIPDMFAGSKCNSWRCCVG